MTSPANGSPAHFATPHLKVEWPREGVAKILLSRVSARNALHPPLIAELTSVLCQLASKDSGCLRVLVLGGEGPVFCAGADLHSMRDQGLQSEEDNRKGAQHLARLFSTLAAFPTPVVCVVQGAAIGGGLGLIACADIVLAEENAVFATSEVLLGLVPAVISPYLVRKIGVGRVTPFLLTGKRMDAKKAMRLGLVNDIVPFSELRETLDRVLEDFLKAAPLATRQTKALIQQASPLPQQTQIDNTVEELVRARKTSEASEGLAAFFAKTQPPWQKNL